MALQRNLSVPQLGPQICLGGRGLVLGFLERLGGLHLAVAELLLGGRQLGFSRCHPALRLVECCPHSAGVTGSLLQRRLARFELVVLSLSGGEVGGARPVQYGRGHRRVHLEVLVGVARSQGDHRLCCGLDGLQLRFVLGPGGDLLGQSGSRIARSLGFSVQLGVLGQHLGDLGDVLAAERAGACHLERQHGLYRRHDASALQAHLLSLAATLVDLALERLEGAAVGGLLVQVAFDRVVEWFEVQLHRRRPQVGLDLCQLRLIKRWGLADAGQVCAGTLQAGVRLLHRALGVLDGGVGLLGARERLSCLLTGRRSLLELAGQRRHLSCLPRFNGAHAVGVGGRRTLQLLQLRFRTLHHGLEGDRRAGHQMRLDEVDQVVQLVELGQLLDQLGRGLGPRAQGAADLVLVGQNQLGRYLGVGAQDAAYKGGRLILACHGTAVVGDLST